MRKIGIMGGTFDPIHTGHLMLAEWARSAAGLSKVWLIPTGRSYKKADTSVLPASERLHMAKLATIDNEALVCLDLEVKRDGYTYSYETVELLKKEYPEEELYFIVGADCLYDMETWKYPERIMNSCTILAAARGDVSLEELDEKRLELMNRFGGNIILLPFLQFSVSSSQIRERIRQGLSIRYMLPDRVLEYIKEKGFYRE